MLPGTSVIPIHLGTVRYIPVCRSMNRVGHGGCKIITKSGVEGSINKHDFEVLYSPSRDLLMSLKAPVTKVDTEYDLLPILLPYYNAREAWILPKY